MDPKPQTHITIRQIGLEQMVSRLKEEHVEMRRDLTRLENAADQADRTPGVLEAAGVLQAVRLELLPFIKRLEQHAAWEEEELIPLLETYFNRHTVPTMTTSIWVMEKDHELANEFLNAYLQAVSGFGPHPGAAAVAEAIRCLRQGCRLLREHFSIEEQTLFPSAEEMLTDLEYLFS